MGNSMGELILTPCRSYSFNFHKKTMNFGSDLPCGGSNPPPFSPSYNSVLPDLFFIHYNQNLEYPASSRHQSSACFVKSYVLYKFLLITKSIDLHDTNIMLGFQAYLQELPCAWAWLPGLGHATPLHHQCHPEG